MNIRLSAAAVAVAAAFPGFSGAQERDEAQLNPVVVTATRQPVRLDQVLAETTVIERDEIERAGNSTLPELLARSGGIEMSSNGGAGHSANIYIRGANGNHTLVLIDGVRVGSATLGSAPFERIPLSQIERIEIVRGPSSALYGSDAIGGVIQIFTRRDVVGAFKPELFVGAGNRGSYELSAGGAGSAGALSYSLRAGVEGTEGFSSVANEDSTRYSPDSDGYYNRNFSGSVGLRLSERHRAGASLFHSDGRNRFDSKYTWPFVSPASFDYTHDRKAENASAFVESQWTSAWLSTLKVGSGVDDSVTRNAPDRKDAYRTNQTLVSWQNDIDLPLGKALVGIESLRQKIESSNEFDRTERTIRSALLGWSANIDRHGIQLNMRRDRNSQFGEKTTGFAGYGYKLTSTLRASVSYGTAFKMPTFNDLYYGGPGGLPNPDLRPEQSRSWEAALNYRSGTDRVGVTAWRNEIENLIDWAPNPTLDDPWNWSPMNIERAVIKGVSLTAGTVIGAWELAANLDLQDPENAGTGKLLRRRARQHGALSLAYSAGKATLGGELRFAGKRYDDANNTIRLAGYGITNLFGQYQLARNWTLEGRVNNVFDRDVVMATANNFDGTFSVFELPGRTVFIGARYAPR